MFTLSRFSISLLMGLTSLASTATTVNQAPPFYPNQPNYNCAGFNLQSHIRGILPFHSQHQELWVSARAHEVYTIRAFNHCDLPVLAVFSVDGLNIIDGSQASVKGRGYIIPPFEQVHLQGWRKNLDQSAQFYFTPKSDSYAARTGRSANLGVIAAAFFFENPPPYLPLMADPKPLPAPTATRPLDHSIPEPTLGTAQRAEASPPPHSMSQKSTQLGTGHGERIHDPVRTSVFERQPYPFSKMAVRYDTYPNLKKRRIVQVPDPIEEQFYFTSKSPENRKPNPFPQDEYEFSPDPRP